MDSAKQPWEWEEADMAGLIRSKTEEHIGLDYKRCDALQNTDAKKTELSKDVSAFANSAGGTIVYGMIEEDRVPTAIDTGFDPTQITGEWIEQIIGSRIHRRIDGVRIKAVPLSGAKSGRVAYVVHVPQSMRAPHQAHDKKFYKRQNFHSVPMEEYEIRDVARRAESPDLRLEWRVSKRDVAGESAPDKFPDTQLFIDITILNDSPTPAMYIVARMHVDARLTVVGPPELVLTGDTTLSVAGDTIDVRRYGLNWCIPGRPPVFDGVSFNLCPPLILRAPYGHGVYFLKWTLLSPGMVPKSGMLRLWIETDRVNLDKYDMDMHQHEKT